MRRPPEKSGVGNSPAAEEKNLPIHLNAGNAAAAVAAAGAALDAAARAGADAVAAVAAAAAGDRHRLLRAAGSLHLGGAERTPKFIFMEME